MPVPTAPIPGQNPGTPIFSDGRDSLRKRANPAALLNILAMGHVLAAQALLAAGEPTWKGMFPIAINIIN